MHVPPALGAFLQCKGQEQWVQVHHPQDEYSLWQRSAAQPGACSGHTHTHTHTHTQTHTHTRLSTNRPAQHQVRVSIPHQLVIKQDRACPTPIGLSAGSRCAAAVPNSAPPPTHTEATQEGVYSVVPDSASAVGALRTSPESRRRGDGMHHLYAHALETAPPGPQSGDQRHRDPLALDRGHHRPGRRRGPGGPHPETSPPLRCSTAGQIPRPLPASPIGPGAPQHHCTTHTLPRQTHTKHSP